MLRDTLRISTALATLSMLTANLTFAQNITEQFFHIESQYRTTLAASENDREQQIAAGESRIEALKTLLDTYRSESSKTNDVEDLYVLATASEAVGETELSIRLTDKLLKIDSTHIHAHGLRIRQLLNAINVDSKKLDATNNRSKRIKEVWKAMESAMCQTKSAIELTPYWGAIGIQCGQLGKPRRSIHAFLRYIDSRFVQVDESFEALEVLHTLMPLIREQYIATGDPQGIEDLLQAGRQKLELIRQRRLEIEPNPELDWEVGFRRTKILFESDKRVLPLVNELISFAWRQALSGELTADRQRHLQRTVWNEVATAIDASHAWNHDQVRAWLATTKNRLEDSAELDTEWKSLFAACLTSIEDHLNDIQLAMTASRSPEFSYGRVASQFDANKLTSDSILVTVTPANNQREARPVAEQLKRLTFGETTQLLVLSSSASAISDSETIFREAFLARMPSILIRDAKHVAKDAMWPKLQTTWMTIRPNGENQVVVGQSARKLTHIALHK